MEAAEATPEFDLSLVRVRLIQSDERARWDALMRAHQRFLIRAEVRWGFNPRPESMPGDPGEGGRRRGREKFQSAPGIDAGRSPKPRHRPSYREHDQVQRWQLATF